MSFKTLLTLCSVLARGEGFRDFERRELGLVLLQVLLRGPHGAAGDLGTRRERVSVSRIRFTVYGLLASPRRQ